MHDSECPKNDPDCLSREDECHDACERPGTVPPPEPFVWTLRLSDAEGWQYHEELRGKVMIETLEAPEVYHDAEGKPYPAEDDEGRPIIKRLRRYTLHPTPDHRTRLELATGGPTDEGWARAVTTITQKDGYWLLEQDLASKDCDGRLDRHEEGTSEGGQPEPGHFNSPITWGQSSQRDHSAEAMGY